MQTITAEVVLAHLSICDRNLVSKMPLVFSVSEICPRNRKPLLVRSIRICLTISPRYMPLHIFSYLPCKGDHSHHANAARSETSPVDSLGKDVSPLFALIQRVLVYCLVISRPDVIQTAVVSKCSPLHIDTHAPLISIHNLDVLHLLHVTSVAAGS